MYICIYGIYVNISPYIYICLIMKPISRKTLNLAYTLDAAHARAWSRQEDSQLDELELQLPAGDDEACLQA